MGKIIRLTESDLTRLVRRVIKEQGEKDPSGWKRDRGYWVSPVLSQEQSNYIKQLNMDRRNDCSGGRWKFNNKDGVNFFCQTGGKNVVVLPKPVDSDPSVNNGMWRLSREGSIFMYDK